MDLEKQMKEKINIINKALEETLPPLDAYPPIIHQAMHYSVFSGGKRLRPLLLIASYEMFNSNISNCLSLACALEFIHTYSLIHDDLPAMDNDDYRRGKPTCHKVFGEGIAILTGDALLNFAFEIILKDVRNNPHHIEAAITIAEASGINGMIGGQVMDLLYENKKIDAQTLEYIHSHKTAALICAAVKAGAMAAGASCEYVKAIEEYGNALGMAFQINDDILDVNEGRKEETKATYPALYGIQGALEAVKEYTFKAVNSLAIFGQKSRFLKDLAIYMMERDK